MSREIELEKTYLAKFLPVGLDSCTSKEIIDIYFPKSAHRSYLRIRRSGNLYFITKKTPTRPETFSQQVEETISLTAEEFSALSTVDGNKIIKTRYYYPYNNQTAEIGIFSGKHKGLVLVDFEFRSIEEMDNFEMPDFCLADVTEEEIIAGGVLSHETMSSVMKVLKKFSYQMISQ